MVNYLDKKVLIVIRKEVSAVTAEIAVMNKRAIALAADSAVTIGDRAKFYNTANKLFMLSKYEPVGIMIYNNAEFMGVPWETLVKDYRLQLGKECKNKLEEYGEDFFKFVFSKKDLFVSYEPTFFKLTVDSYLGAVKNDIRKRYIRKYEQTHKQLKDAELAVIANQAIEKYYTRIISATDLDEVPKELLNQIRGNFEGLLIELIGEHSDFSFAEPQWIENLKEACYHLFVKDVFVDVYSGVVFAGFGKDDTFPVLVSYNVAGMISGFLKKKKMETIEIDNEHDFGIVPFAQTDTVWTFLYGVNDKYLNTLNGYFQNRLLNKIGEMDDNIFKKDGKTRLRSGLEKLWSEVIEGINDYSQREYLAPILRAVRVLPIDELASMAESLVNLTSFRRQVALDEYSYTVGGPIDVAVISKGDGFVWIKRKHYFKPELNHHFFKNYFSEDCEERGGSDEET